MNWLYNKEEITNTSQLPDDTFGFIYKIKHIPSGKSYIGKKFLRHFTKKKLTKKDLALYEGQPGRKPKYKIDVKESNWKDYWGSNKPLQEVFKKEPRENFQRTIIKLAPTKKLLTYYEVKYQFIYQVLEKPDEFFNDNILGKFFTKDFEPPK